MIDIAQPTISIDFNTNTQASPTWTNATLPLSGTGVELRWSDSTAQTATASASWPAFVRPASGTTNATSFALYYFSADTTGSVLTALAFANANYNQCRWSDAGDGSWASAPILTAYDDNTHAAPTSRGSSVFPNNLSGNTTDTGATARSYLKANAYGAFNNAPGAAPSNVPTVTDGTTGSVAPGGATSWLTNYQGLMADVDYITCQAQPANTTAQKWYFMLALFSGANMATGTYSSSVVSLKYTWV